MWLISTLDRIIMMISWDFRVRELISLPTPPIAALTDFFSMQMPRQITGIVVFYIFAVLISILCLCYDLSQKLSATVVGLFYLRFKRWILLFVLCFYISVIFVFLWPSIRKIVLFDPVFENFCFCLTQYSKNQLQNVADFSNTGSRDPTAAWPAPDKTGYPRTLTSLHMIFLLFFSK